MCLKAGAEHICIHMCHSPFGAMKIMKMMKIKANDRGGEKRKKNHHGGLAVSTLSDFIALSLSYPCSTDLVRIQYTSYEEGYWHAQILIHKCTR